jgi:hypothetical protein
VLLDLACGRATLHVHEARRQRIFDPKLVSQVPQPARRGAGGPPSSLSRRFALLLSGARSAR